MHDGILPANRWTYWTLTAALAAAACTRAELPTATTDELEDEYPAGQSSGGKQGNGTITPVLFVPSDRTVDASDVAAVNAGLADVASWYEAQLGDAKLRMEPLVTVAGKYPSSWYLTDDRIWSEGPAELEASLGYGPWTTGHVVVVIGAGLLGWAGGNDNGNGTAGYAAVGLESLTDNTACAGESWCTPTVWRGTVIHELGHALTLDHSVAPSIMDLHYDYTAKVLLDTAAWPEKTKVRSLQFVDLVGGNANWESCASDGDCSSKRCGCHDGGSELVCLPSVAYPDACAPAKKSNWAACASDGECESNRCGCGGGQTPVCLPSPAYSKDCPPAQQTCGQLAAQNGWASALCEWNGNGACSGQGAETSDCDHCCDASQVPPGPGPSCGELAQQNGWAGAACEWSGNGACGGVGQPTWDCDHCCEAG